MVNRSDKPNSFSAQKSPSGGASLPAPGTGDGWIEQTPYVLPNYSGRYPLGATADINSLVEGGLPNIEGTATDNAYVGNSTQFSSAFKSSTVRSEKTNLLFNDKNNQWSKWGGLVFKASDSNAIYGKSTTVTPPSVKCAFLIRHD